MSTPASGQARLGFACAWGRHPRATWSGTPWHLREALVEHVDVRDVGIRIPWPVQAAFRGGLGPMWRHSRAWEHYSERQLRRGVARAGCDAVLEIQDLARLDVPFYVMQDLSYDVLLERYDGRGVTHFPGLGLDAIRRRRDRQLHIYAEAAGIIAMSQWFARQLVEKTGLPAAKVHVVHPGATAATGHAPGNGVRRDPPRRSLLFVGRDFHTKGGDLVVEAVDVLRRQWDPTVTLTVAGPSRWPLPGEVPAGVRFLGPVGVEAVAALMDSHDLLVMPSRLEGFGIVFVEALARGLPCVGRRDFAMPEIIDDGRTGRLVDGDDGPALAAVIAEVLDDDAIYDQTWRSRDRVAAYFTWARAARELVEVVAPR